MTVNPLSTDAPQSASAPESGPARFSPLDLVRLLRQYGRVLVAVAVVGMVAGTVAALALKKFSPEFTSEAYLEVTGNIADPYESATANTGISRQRLEVVAAFIRNQIVRIKSDPVINEALKYDEIKQTHWYRQFALSGNGDQLDAPREALQSQLNVSRLVGSTVIRVSMSGRYKDDLPAIINTVIKEYLRQYQFELSTYNDNVLQTFKRERRSADDELKSYQARLDQFTTQHDLATLETSNNEATIAYESLAQQSAELELALHAARSAYQALQQSHESGKMQVGPNDLAAVEADPAIASRDEKLRVLREQRQVYLNRFGESHRTVQDIDLQMAAVEREKQLELQRLLRERQAVLMDQAARNVSGLEARLAALAPKREEARQRVNDLVQKLKEYGRLEAQAKAAEARGQRAEDFVYKEEILSKRPDKAGVREMAAASAPKLTFPQFTGTIAGITILFEAIAVGIILLRELLDQRIKRPADMRLIPNVNVIGVIPAAEEDPMCGGAIEHVVELSRAGLLAEAFRQTRTALMTPIRRGGLKTLMFVAAQPEAGNSVMVHNLALSLANEGRRVLVIDANLRRPGQHALMGARVEPGLFNVLHGQNGLTSAIAHQVGHAKLDLLPAGTKRPGGPELLESEPFAELLGWCGEQYDVVLIDAPPALLTSEARMLAAKVDGIVMTVRAMHDKRGMVHRVLRELRAQDGNVLGVILNDVRASAGGYFRKNFDAFYAYQQPEAAEADDNSATVDIDPDEMVIHQPAPSPQGEARPWVREDAQEVVSGLDEEDGEEPAPAGPR